MENDAYANCSYSNTTQIVTSVVITATSFLSFISCLFAVFLVVLFQKYRTSTQRIILYLVITVLLYSVVQILHVAGDNNKVYCTISGFADQHFGTMVLMAITCLSVDLFIKVMFKRETTWTMEVIYITVIFFSPLLYNWIPFIKGAYGFSGLWCWIRAYNPDCSVFLFGLILQFVLYWAPFYVIATALLVITVTARIKVSKSLKVYRGKTDITERQVREQLLREIRQYQLYPVIYIAVNIFPVIARILEAVDISIQIEIIRGLHAFFVGLQGAMISLAFSLDYDTRKHLNYRSFKSSFVRLFSKEKTKIKDYNMVNVRSDSLKKKFLVNRPSNSIEETPM